MDEIDPARVESANARYCVDTLVAQTRLVWEANPTRFGKGSIDHVRRYLAGEFDALTEHTVALYRDDIELAQRTGRNVPFETYSVICRQVGTIELIQPRSED